MTSVRLPETGDRAAFLNRLRARAAAGSGSGKARSSAHPAPPPDPHAPPVRFRAVDPHPDADHTDLVDVFARTITDQAATVHRCEGTQVPLDVLRSIVDEHHIETAVLSREPAARALAAPLREVGVQVSTSVTPADVAGADLGVTSAVAGIAATGSVVVDCSVAGSRTVSLLCPVHVCVVPASAVVATPGDVLRPLGAPGHRLPSNLVVISGPSRTGDIEQLITLGVHGPVAVHVIVTDVPRA